MNNSEFEVFQGIRDAVERIAENTKPAPPQPDPDLMLLSNILADISNRLYGILDSGADYMVKSKELRALSYRLVQMSENYAKRAEEKRSKNRL